MSDMIREALKQALVAFHIHAPPEKVLANLDIKNALKRIPNVEHCIYDLVHHMLFWQEMTLDAIDDNDVDWSRADSENWPTSDVTPSQQEFDSIVQRLIAGISSFQERATQVDLESTMKAWPQGTKLWAIQMIAQHNSYHLGQIVTIRQALGDWEKA